MTPPPVGCLSDGEIAMLRAWAEDYAAAAVKEEREACATEALRHVTHPEDPANEVWQCAYNIVANEIAAAIRSRGDAPKTEGE